MSALFVLMFLDDRTMVGASELWHGPGILLCAGHDSDYDYRTVAGEGSIGLQWPSINSSMGASLNTLTGVEP